MKSTLWSKWSKARNQQKTNGNGSLPWPRGNLLQNSNRNARKTSQHPANTGVICPAVRILIFRDTSKICTSSWTVVVFALIPAVREAEEGGAL